MHLHERLNRGETFTYKMARTYRCDSHVDMEEYIAANANQH